MRILSRCWKPAIAGLSALSGQPVFAEQAVSPAVVTPATLVPLTTDKRMPIAIPATGSIRPPAGAERVHLTIGQVELVGGIPEVNTQASDIAKKIVGREITLTDVYDAASEIQNAYASAGFFLSRVTIPAQEINSGSKLTIIIINGFVEGVDVTGLPRRFRKPAVAGVGDLVRKPLITIHDAETALNVVGALPGLSMRSTLTRGNELGGTRIILEGEQKLLEGTISSDNQLPASLGFWSASLQLSLNSPFGLGEQIYALASSDYRLGKIFSDDSRERILGGGAIVPFGNGRLSVNPEFTFSRTAPAVALGSPQSLGTLRRLSLRLNDTLAQTRAVQAALQLSAEQIDYENKIPSVAVLISHDRYLRASLRGIFSLVDVTGSNVSLSLQFSKGLGSLAAISAADAMVSGVPYSRQGTDNGFQKLNAAFRAVWQIGKGFSFSVSGRGQTSFGAALFRPEQFTLEGADALSAYDGGRTSVDSGVVVRTELRLQENSHSSGRRQSLVAPYLFTAFGVGRLEQPTVLEANSLSAFSLGGGIRMLLASRLALNVEFARGRSSERSLDGANRVNVSTSLHF